MTTKILERVSKDKYRRLIIIISVIHWCITFFTDHLVFDALPGNGVMKDFTNLEDSAKGHFFVCKLILLFLIYFIWNTVIKLLVDIVRVFKEKTIRPELAGVQFRIFKYALVYLVPIMAVMIFKLPEGFLSNDESLIFAEASALNTYTWFYYLTTYYYITTMMLIPSWLGPVLVKVALQVITCGYCVWRMRDYIISKQGGKRLLIKGRELFRADYLAFLLYLPFMMFPVLAYTTSAHRIPVYYLLYLLMLFTMVMDRLMEISVTPGKLFWLMVCGALITQWRTEGIYMAGLIIILLFIAYPELIKNENSKLNIKRSVIIIILSLLVQYAVQIPQNGVLPSRMGDQADNRMGPFWAYTITNMYRNGLDLEKNAEDMEKVWRYLDRNVLASINEDLGDINYEDVLILYYPGYTGVMETATPEDYSLYVEGCKNIFKNNPDVLLKTRWSAFCYAALPYHINAEGGVAGWLFSIFKAGFYNLFIPCTLVVIFLLLSLFKKKWLYFFIMSGLCCHWFIVFVLAPASYFKYYLPIYMIAYFSLVFSFIKKTVK